MSCASVSGERATGKDNWACALGSKGTGVMGVALEPVCVVFTSDDLVSSCFLLTGV